MDTARARNWCYVDQEDWEMADDQPTISVFRPDSAWRDLFDQEALSHFRAWSSPTEHHAYIKDLETRPIREMVHSEPRIEPPWDFIAMIRAFEDGEFRLIACRVVDTNLAHLEFDPLAYPYGGTGCMKALITAYGFQVIGEDDGTGYYRF